MVTAVPTAGLSGPPPRLDRTVGPSQSPCGYGLPPPARSPFMSIATLRASVTLVVDAPLALPVINNAHPLFSCPSVDPCRLNNCRVNN